MNADANATLVKIGKSVKGNGAVGTSMVSTADTTSVYPINCSPGYWCPISVSGRENAYSDYRWCSGTFDLSLASEMRITYSSADGSYTYEKKCDDITDWSRQVEFAAKVNGKDKTFYTRSSDDRIWETTLIISRSDMQRNGINQKNVSLGYRVKTRNKNRNATMGSWKWEIVYPNYTFSVVNTSGKGWPNTYVERIYTAAGSKASGDRYNGVSREGSTIMLGQGFVNGQGSASVSTPSDRLEFSYQLLQSNKNSMGVTVHPGRVKFLGWQLRSKKNSSQWSSTLSSIKFDGDFLNKYSDYILSGNRFEVRPVFEVIGTSTRFRNEGSNKGQYTGYPNDSYINMTKLDTVEVTAAAKTGFSVSGFTVNGGETSNTGRRDQIKVTPNANCTLHLLYEEPSITVQADLKGNNTSKGSVFYSDYSDPQKPVELSGNKDKVMTVKPVSLDQQYRIVGLPQEGWLTYWRDGTLDGVVGAPDGAIDEKELAAYKEYNSFSPVSGNVLAYVPTLSFAKIYYDFYPVTKIENPMSIEGRVYLKQTEIFTGKTTTTGLDGATVTSGEATDNTSTEPATKRSKGGPGYFYLDDDTFGVYSYHLVNVNYVGPQGGSVNASAVCTPGSFKELTIDANDRMWVESTAATARIYEVTKENGKESLRLIEDLSGVNNGDATFRLALKVDHIPSVVPTKAILRFYSTEGKQYEGTVEADIDNNHGGLVNLDFNPKDLGLPEGTRLTLQFVDQNKKASLEQETGIKLTKAIGVLDLVNSFEFGGANTAIKIIGNINSAFNLGWNGDFDRSDAVTASERDGLKMRTISLGFATSAIEKEKELAGLSKVAGDKTENDENLANLKKDLAKETDPKKKTELQSEVTAAESEKAVSDAAYDQALANAADPHKTQTTMAASVNVDVGFKFAMSFALDEETSQWYFHDMMVYAEVSGGAGMDMSFATPIGITINIGFGAGGDGSALFVVEERKDLDEPKKYYLTDLVPEGEESNKINIFDFNKSDSERAFDASGTFEVNPYIFLKAGAGLGGIVEVSVKGTAQFYMTFYTDDQENTGSVTLEAAIGVKVLFIGGEWPFASTDIPLFGDSASVLEPLEKENYLYESSDMLTALDRPYLENQGAFNGEGIMSAMSVQEDGAGVDTSVLQKGVYGSLHTKMMRLDGNKILAVYLNDDGSRSAENAAAAYYMLYDGKEWSKPAMLEDDKTLDQAPVIEDLGDHGVLVAWSTANKEFNEETSGVEMQNSLNIHAVIFDKKTGKPGDVMEVTENTDEDDVADVNPNVSCSGDKMIVYYTKNEYAVSGSTGEVIGDVIHPAESLMAYRIYDFKTQTWKTEYTEAEKAEIMENMQLDESGFTDYQNNWYGQVFLNTAPGIYIDEELDEEGYWTEEPTIYDGYTVTKGEIEKNEVGEDTTKVTGTSEPVESQVEPKVIDSDCITYNDISIFAYVIDYDNDLKTVNDRDIYMQLYDFEKDTFSHPIMVTSDDVEDANVRFLRRNRGGDTYESTYLAYLSGGDVKMINVSTLVANVNDQDPESSSLIKAEKNGVEYYYINKAADSENYKPPVTVVEGAVKEDSSAASNKVVDRTTGEVVEEEVSESDESEEAAEEEACAVTGFDVQTQGDYIYLVWTQNKFTLADGVEEGTPEASEAENQKVETQIYAMRSDGTESSDPVQITEGNGLNYGNVAFVAGDDGSMKMLASCTESTLETYEEFKASAEEFNKTAAEEDKVKIPAEEDYVPYAKEDESTTSLVSLDVKCNEACLAVEDIEPMDLASGQDNSISFKIVNEGLANIEDVTVTVEDEQGRAQLVESSVFEQDDPDTEGGKIETQRTETVESIRIPSMRGGETWNGTVLYTLAEDETDVAFTIKVKSGDKTVAEQTFTDSIKDSIGVSDFTVEETDVRNQFVLKATVDNLADRISEENTVEFTLKDQKIAEVAVPKLEQGQSVELETEVTVDSKNLFVTEDVRNEKTGELLGKSSTGNFKAAVDGSELEETVERYVSADAYSYIEGIQAAMINDGKPITVKEGEYKKVDMNIKSSLDETLKKYVGADGSVMTGTAGLQVIWVSDDESIVTPYQNGSIEAKAAGTTTLYAYVMPKNEEVLAEGTEEAEETPGTFTEVSNYTKLPDEAIRVYSTTVTVSKAGAAVVAPPALPKVGTDVTSGGQTYVVTKAAAAQKEVSYKGTVNKKAKSVVIPATIQIGTDAYKVTAVKNDAFKNNKSLQKVTIGSNVASIGKNAFKGCVKLTKVTFKGSALKKVGASAFEGCKKLKKLTVPKSVKTIGKKAYYGCTALRKVTFKTKQKTKIGKNAFGKTHKKATFTVPKKYLKAYKKSLKKAKIGKKAKVKGR